MPETTEKNKSANAANLRDHMANERTFLAWIRTSIGIMAFGFVVEKFSYFFEKNVPLQVSPSAFGYSSIFGIVLVALGAIMGLLALVRYKKVERQINQNTYQPSILIDILVAMGIIIIGIFLIFYMIHTITS